jgi:hypothetical protein
MCLCLMPGNFICHEESAATQQVKLQCYSDALLHLHFFTVTPEDTEGCLNSTHGSYTNSIPIYP